MTHRIMKSAIVASLALGLTFGSASTFAADAISLDALLERFCLRQTSLSIGELNGSREHVYQVKLLRGRNHEALLRALRDELGADDAKLLLQDSASEY